MGDSSLALAELDQGELALARPEIDRAQIARYFFRSALYSHILVTVFTFGFWLPVLLLWMLGLGQWYAYRRAQELDYRLLPGRLLIADGVFTKVRKTIPLDKVTDVGLSQGIIERWHGLWRVNVQTASSGQQTPEGSMFGLADPKHVRAILLGERERWLDVSDEDTALVATNNGRAVAKRPVAAPEAPAKVVDRLDRIESLLSTIAANTRNRDP